MNREIKFRAFDQGTMVYENDDFNNWISSGDILKRFDNVTQFTGLKDKNGVEIYEGDIINFTQACTHYGEETVYDEYVACGVIHYNSDACNYEIREYLDNRDGTFEKETIDDSEEVFTQDAELEVIGNIYENKELLE